MTNNYLLNDSIISPLGFDTQTNLESIQNKKSALKLHKFPQTYPDGFYAGIIEEEGINFEFNKIGNPEKFTKLEKMLILSIQQVIHSSPNIDLEETGLIISTTKGNIDLLDNPGNFESNRIFLWRLAEVIAHFFKLKSKPIVISNACISGALAIKVANDFIEAKQFKHMLVAAGDLVSNFVVSGFKSFNAISSKPCSPYSSDRDGISLGETAAAILIGPANNTNSKIKFIDATTVNDANHISGPSRTGEGLFLAVSKLMEHTGIKKEEIDYISAHGTATIFNDEMEAMAFNRMGMGEIPLNSFKGYYGHSLGASALVESILTKHSLLNNKLFESLNFLKAGTSNSLSIITQSHQQQLKYALKTASGFGGCNLAMLLKKEVDA